VVEGQFESKHAPYKTMSALYGLLLLRPFTVNCQHLGRAAFSFVLVQHRLSRYEKFISFGKEIA